MLNTCVIIAVLLGFMDLLARLSARNPFALIDHVHDIDPELGSGEHFFATLKKSHFCSLQQMAIFECEVAGVEALALLLFGMAL
jgi:hypothetical protein